MPPNSLQLSRALCIARDISFQFWLPVGLVAATSRLADWACGVIVLVPEATVYEDGKPPRREYEIRAARKFAPLKAKT